MEGTGREGKGHDKSIGYEKFKTSHEDEENILKRERVLNSRSMQFFSEKGYEIRKQTAHYGVLEVDTVQKLKLKQP